MIDTERFWAKVKKLPGENACWEWTANKTVGGYGKFGVKGRKPRMITASHIAWELTYGKPPVMRVLHHCDNPACVRPSHLFEGTQTDNMRDASAKGRLRSGETHPRTKLTANQVREIREAYATGAYSSRSLADKYGLCDGSAVIKIIHKKSWRHVC